VALRAAVFAAVTGSDAAETDQALDPTSVEAAIDRERRKAARFSDLSERDPG
jgi:hypothetical protein